MGKLAIVGGGQGYKNALVTGCEIWTIQSVFEKLGRADKVFRLHQHELDLPGIDDTEIVTFDNMPVQNIAESFGNYFHSSISWMIGYAVLIGYKYIELHGVDMLITGEYGKQRDGLFRMIGIAQMLQVVFIIPEWSGVYIKPELYGIENIKELKKWQSKN
jgi:hypothetical protein